MARLYSELGLRDRLKRAYYTHLNGYALFTRGLHALFIELDKLQPPVNAPTGGPLDLAQSLERSAQRLLAQTREDQACEWLSPSVDVFRAKWPLPDDAGVDIKRTYLVDWQGKRSATLRCVEKAGSAPTAFDLTLEPVHLTYVPFLETEAEACAALDLAVENLRRTGRAQIAAIAAATKASGWRAPGPRHRTDLDLERLTWRGFRTWVHGDSQVKVLVAELDHERGVNPPCHTPAISRSIRALERHLQIVHPVRSRRRPRSPR